MRWTIGFVVFLLERMGFTDIRKERAWVDQKNKIWIITARIDGKEYQGFGITARIAFEDLITQWFKEVRG